jgi:hypothetical protein
VRPEDILSAVSDSAEARIVASDSAECNSAGRTDWKSVFQLRGDEILPFGIDRKMFVFEALGDRRRMFGLDLLAGSR